MAFCEITPRAVVTPSPVMRNASPQTTSCGFAAAARAESWIERPAERAAVAGRVPAAVEREVAPVVHFRALAPPEKPLGIIHHAQLLGQFDLAKR